MKIKPILKIFPFIFLFSCGNNPVGPVIPKPTESIVPTTSVNPTNPVLPTEPIAPTEPVIPTVPVEPTKKRTESEIRMISLIECNGTFCDGIYSYVVAETKDDESENIIKISFNENALIDEYSWNISYERNFVLNGINIGCFVQSNYNWLDWINGEHLALVSINGYETAQINYYDVVINEEKNIIKQTKTNANLLKVDFERYLDFCKIVGAESLQILTININEFLTINNFLPLF